MSGDHRLVAFMFGLYESCQLNNLDFDRFIEDILTRIVNGEGIEEETAA